MQYGSGSSRIIIMLLLLLIILQGCAGAGDYDIQLPGQFSVVRTSAHQVTISPKESSHSWGSPVVPAKVVQVAWNEDYILAKQWGLKQDPSKSSFYEIPDQTKEYYWIIHINSKEVFGPLDSDEYIEKKKELAIPETVQLKDLDKYAK